MDKIYIDELKIFARHGVFEDENIQGQNFYVNAALYIDTEKAGLLDSLDCSVDYSSVCTLIGKVMTENIFSLIETAAQTIAEAILREYPLVRQTDIEVRKPEAPIDMEFRSVSVRISRGWHTAVIALGSNMGNSQSYIDCAVSELESSRHIRNIRCSELIVTKPYGFTDQEDFLNGALICETMLSPHGLLSLMQSIENNAHRTREIHWGPRTLDLDLIFYDNYIIDDKDLTVPHPDMQNRDFVLRPLAHIAPYYRHPLLSLTVKQLLERLENDKHNCSSR